VADVADSPNFWWRERADFETKVLVPNATSWSVVGRDLVSNGIIEGRIGGTKYFLRVPASASELTGDARCSSPESHKKLAEKVVSVWPRQHGRFVRAAGLLQHFESLESTALESILEGINSVGLGGSPSQGRCQS